MSVSPARASSGRSSKLAVAVWLGLLAAAPAGAQPDPRQAQDRSAFRSWFEQQAEHPTPLSAAALDTARQYRYVLIAGLLNEAFQIGYFNENRKALLDAGVKPDAVHLIFPKSGNGVDDNVAVLLRTIPELAAKGPQPLVLIGHSKGAVEALAFVVASSDFVREHVRAVFLVQGAFGGSGIADYVTGRGHPLDERMSRGQRAEFTIAAQGGKLLDARLDRGFQSMTHLHAADLWDRLLPPAGQRGVVSRLPEGIGDKVFFVRSRRDPGKVSPLLAVTAHYLSAYYGANDGLVEVADQWIAGTGRILATLNADHVALTIAGPVSDRRWKVRRALTYALVMQLAGAFDR